MSDQVHIVRVFVFRQDGSDVEYLMVRHRPEHDSFWSPVTGLMKPHESIFQAAVRSVGEELGLTAPRQIVDLQLATHTQIGEFEEIDWAVGYRTRETGRELYPSDELAGIRWLDFDSIYQNLDSEDDRRSVMRLHFTLRAAG